MSAPKDLVQALIDDLKDSLRRGIADSSGKALDEAFAKAAIPAEKLKAAGALGSAIFKKGKDLLTELYSTYVQALRGNNPSPVPKGDFKSREKCTAWNLLKDRTIREAQLEYISLVIQIAEDFRSSSALKSFCKDIYSKPETFKMLYTAVLVGNPDEKDLPEDERERKDWMEKRRAALSPAETALSGTVTVLSDKAKERLVKQGFLKAGQDVSIFSAKTLVVETKTSADSDDLAARAAAALKQAQAPQLEHKDKKEQLEGSAVAAPLPGFAIASASGSDPLAQARKAPTPEQVFAFSAFTAAAATSSLSPNSATKKAEQKAFGKV